MSKEELYRLPGGVVAKLEMKSIDDILKDKGLDPQGNAQAFHTQNVLRRIQRYMPFRSGMTIKVTIAQTDIQKPEIITDVPYGQRLFHGESSSGAPLNYTKTKNPQAGPYWDRALKAAEGDALVEDLQRFLKRGGKV